jgi:hypothetical protein
MRQGPHQGAQKSTNTGTEEPVTSVSKFASVISITFALAMIFEKAVGVVSRGESGNSRSLHHGPDLDRKRDDSGYNSNNGDVHGDFFVGVNLANRWLNGLNLE